MKILFIGAHTDDIELGCGGTIARMVEEGHDVYCTCCSYCGKDQLRKEFYDSMQFLGVTYSGLNEFPVRSFDKYRQEILEYLIRIRKEFMPDQVFTHSHMDRHQDHWQVGAESLRAFRDHTMFSYTSSFNRLSGEDDCYIKLSDSHLLAKEGALNKYESQADKFYMRPNYNTTLASLLGARVGLEYSESFQTLKQII